MVRAAHYLTTGELRITISALKLALEMSSRDHNDERTIDNLIKTYERELIERMKQQSLSKGEKRQNDVGEELLTLTELKGENL
ncbi:MAG: hypothetical protein PHQ86_09295 [Dehalococcoidales bacterium]|nr:hypothetical protein [Dehalococcoidales bacterium]